MTKLTATIITLEASKHPLQGTTKFAGMSISIENKKGSTRSGVGADGKPWSVKMPFDYGYIGRTKGPDGDAYDCFIGPNPSAKFAYVVHQCKQLDKAKWDEDKVMLGFDSADAAIRAYKSAYNNVDLFHSMTVMPMDVFKKKVAKTYSHKRHDKLHAGGPGSGRRPMYLNDEKLPSEEGYLYHATNEERARDIADDSLKPHRPGDYTDQESWPDGSTKKRSYFSKNAEVTKSFAPDEGRPVIVRTKHTDDFKKELGTGDVFTNKPVASNKLEILDSDKKWQPLHTFFASMYAVNYGGDVGYDYRQFREGTAIQPLTNNFPPSLKNPIRVPVDNPDDKEDKYGDKKKRRSKAIKKFYKELARRQSDKPEIANTTAFVPLSQG